MKLPSKRTAVRTLITLAVAAACTNVSAATFTVTKVADTNDGVCNSDCSLREAIVAANNLAGADVINVPQGNYVLTRTGANEDLSATGDLDIRDQLTINGAGRTLTTINGNQQDRIFEIIEGKNVLLTKLAVVNGINQYSGAGILNAGNLTLNNVHFDGNVSAGYGGAIESRSNTASLTIDSGLFTNNCSSSGGAMDVVGGLVVSNSVFNGNRPIIKGGIDCKNGDGAAIHVQGGVGATIDKSTFINNVGAVGALTLAFGELTITNSTLAYNRGLGGAIWNSNGAGAIQMQGTTRWGTRLTVKNSTITNNVAFRNGGGIDGTLTLKNTIIANNTAPYGGPDCFGGDGSGLPPGEFVPSPPVSQGNNIFGSVSGCYVVLAATDFVGSPGLAAMATDATTGQTYFPLLANSQAIDRAENASCSTYDQLGKLRPRDGNNDGVAQCDIGAFEKQPAQVANVCPSGCAYTSIQAAINAAAAGATITVGPGTYNEALTLAASKTLLSTHGAQNTVLDGVGLSQSTVVINLATENGSEPGGTVNGFTIKNNSSRAIWGRRAVILNNIIRDNGNTATGYGGFNTDWTGSIIKNNTFINNKGQFGGAISTGAYTGNLITIENNTFLNNSSSTGSAINLSGSYTSPSSISRNVFKGNVSSTGGPVIWVGGYGNDPLLANNLIVENTGSAILVGAYNKARTVNNTVAGNSGGGVGVYQYGTLMVDNSVIRGNSIYDVAGGGYAQVNNSILGPNSDIWGGSVNNSYADPMFVGVGDYRVRAGSPAIDRGKNTASSGVLTDLLGVARPQDGDKLGAGSTGDGSDYDIGAYEFK